MLGESTCRTHTIGPDIHSISTKKGTKLYRERPIRSASSPHLLACRWRGKDSLVQGEQHPSLVQSHHVFIPSRTASIMYLTYWNGHFGDFRRGVAGTLLLDLGRYADGCLLPRSMDIMDASLKSSAASSLLRRFGFVESCQSWCFDWSCLRCLSGL